MKLLIFISIAVFTISCQPKEKKINLLKSDSVNIDRVYIPIFDNENKEWSQGFNYERFKEIISKVTYDKNNFTLDPNEDEFPQNIKANLNTADILNRMGENQNKKANWNEIKGATGFESWTFYENDKIFRKKFEHWYPVRVYCQNGDENCDNPAKKLVFLIRNKEFKNIDTIAKHFIYKQSVFEDNLSTSTNLDLQKFFAYVFKCIDKNELTAYDPIYLVDKSRRKFDKAEVEKYNQIQLNDEKLPHEISDIIFDEDWIIDKDNLSLKKIVNAIGFIRTTYDTASKKIVKKIMFFIVF